MNKTDANARHILQMLLDRLTMVHWVKDETGDEVATPDPARTLLAVYPGDSFASRPAVIQADYNRENMRASAPGQVVLECDEDPWPDNWRGVACGYGAFWETVTDYETHAGDPEWMDTCMRDDEEGRRQALKDVLAGKMPEGFAVMLSGTTHVYHWRIYQTGGRVFYDFDALPNYPSTFLHPAASFEEALEAVALHVDKVLAGVPRKVWRV